MDMHLKCSKIFNRTTATVQKEMHCTLHHNGCRVQLKCDGTRCRTGGEMRGKLANGVSSQYT